MPKTFNFLQRISFERLFLIGVFAHLIMAIFSIGFHQFDEHFQIIEFLNFKLFGGPEKDLPWEYRDQIRPWFQVFLYYFLVYPFKAIGLDSPFFITWVLRTITGLFGLVCTWTLKDWLIEKFENDEIKVKASLFFLTLFWFVPYIHVRTSAESLSLAFGLLGFSLFLKNLEKENFLPSLLTGLILSFSYLAKSQGAIAVAFLWFWAVAFHYKRWRFLTYVAVGVLLGIGLGVVVDYWGYGNWTFSPWNYYRVNIIEDRAAGFGVDPWYYYIKKSFSRGIAPLSLPLIIGTIAFWIKFWKSPLTWFTLPFVLVHTLIGHKELRFLFPVMAVTPLMTYMVWNEWKHRDHKWSFRFVNFFMVLNIILLIGTSFKAANSAFRFYRFLHDSPIREFHVRDESPFTMVGLKVNFFKPKNLKVHIYKEGDLLPKKGNFFFRSGKEFFKYKDKESCKLQYLSYPMWTLNFNVGNWVNRSRVWSLFICD